MTVSIAPRRALLMPYFAASLAACSSDETSIRGVLGEEQAGAAAPAYAIATHIFGSDLAEATTYVLLAEQLESGELNLDQGLEIQGRSYIWAPDASGTFYATSPEQLQIIKYAPGADGRPAPIAQVSVAAAGVTALAGEAMIFPDPNRAWLFDLSSAQAIEIDLEAMVLARTVDISALLDPDPARFPVTYMNAYPLRRRGAWVVAETYAFDFEQEAFSTTSRIVLFNPTTGELVVNDSPCGGLSFTARADSGDLFFSTDPLVAAVHALDPARAPAPCMVRLPADSTAPDPATVALTPLAGGLPTGGLIPGADDTVYLRVLDTEAVPLTPEDTGLGLYSLPNWYTWRASLTSPTSAERLDRAPIAGGIVYFEIDGAIYQNESDAGFSQTTLVRTTGADAPVNALSLPGVPFSIVRVR